MQKQSRLYWPMKFGRKKNKKKDKAYNEISERMEEFKWIYVRTKLT